MRKWSLLATIVAGGLALAFPQVALSSIAQPTVVSENPSNVTPNVLSTSTGVKPHVDSIAQLGSMMYAGGRFDRVSNAGGSTTYTRHNMMAFNASTGAMSASFTPTFNDQVWAVETAGTSVYVGGEFTTVNGASHPRLVKLNSSTGAVDTTFRPNLGTGRVTELDLRNGRLLVGGSAGKKLMALNPTTGADTGYINLGITNAIPNAWGGVAVYRFAVNPAGTKLVATGNFRTVSGQSRTRLFVADLGSTKATLSSWYYPGFAKACSSTAPRRIAYLQGVDYAPNGSYFVVAATGQVPATKADIWGGDQQSSKYTTVCDAVGRFNMSNDQAPVWINYTGGDSVWATAATGSAVYAQGHFQWLDNPNGVASNCPAGDRCASRKGVGAINPSTGKALAWNPGKPAQLGGKDFLATAAGLWVVSDSTRFNGEPRHGIAFCPLP